MIFWVINRWMKKSLVSRKRNSDARIVVKAIGEQKSIKHASVRLLIVNQLSSTDKNAGKKIS